MFYFEHFFEIRCVIVSSYDKMLWIFTLKGGEVTDNDVKTLEAWRRLAFLNQTELATKAGVDKATISRIETGIQKGIKLSTARHIAEALGVRPDQVTEFIPLIEPKKENRLIVTELAQAI